MSIINQLVPEGPPIYYTVEFKRVLEDHLDFIKQHSTTTSIAVNPALAFKHEYNLSGYLLAIDIPLKLHWLVKKKYSSRSGCYLCGMNYFRNPCLYYLPSMSCGLTIRSCRCPVTGRLAVGCNGSMLRLRGLRCSVAP